MLFKLLLALAPSLPQLLPLFRQLLQMLSKNEQEKAEWDRKLVEATKVYQAGVHDAVRVRDAHEELKVKAEEAWQRKWGTPPAEIPANPATGATGKLIAPTSCKVGVEFTIRLEGFPKGTQVYADHTWVLFTLGDVPFVGITLTQTGAAKPTDEGVRTLDVKTPDGKWVLSHALKVAPATAP